MARTKRPGSPLLEIAHMLWRVPVYALPFAAFFLMTSSNRIGRSSFIGYWIASMVFTASIQLMLIIARFAIEPTLLRRFRGDPRAPWFIAGSYMLVSLFGAAVAAVTLHYTVVPGLLGSARGALSMVVYSLMFGALFVGTALAVDFYRQSMERAGSERELLLARRIQRSFLLSEFPQRARIEAHAVNVSSKEVSGDFYDVVAAGDNRLLIAIADVSGKGVPAALLSSMLQASLRTQAALALAPAVMMQAINALACQRAVTGQFATFFLACVDEESLTLRFTNAGHNFPVLLRADGTRELLETGGLVVGMMEGMPYEEGVVSLAAGDRLLMYTDGVSEAANAEGEMFGEDRLYALLGALPASLRAEEIVNRVLEGVRGFLGETEAGDDITVMALRVLPPATAGAPR